MTFDSLIVTMDTEEIVENDETITESCHNDDVAPFASDDNISPKERHKAWQKRKRQVTTQRAKERRIAEWSELSEEQQEERKIKRKEQIEQMEQKLLNALQNGLNVCIDLSFDGVNVSDKVVHHDLCADHLISLFLFTSHSFMPVTIERTLSLGTHERMQTTVVIVGGIKTSNMSNPSSSHFIERG